MIDRSRVKRLAASAAVISAAAVLAAGPRVDRWLALAAVSVAGWCLVSSRRGHAAQAEESRRLRAVNRFATTMAAHHDPGECIKHLLEWTRTELLAETAELVLFATATATARRAGLRARLDRDGMTIAPEAQPPGSPPAEVRDEAHGAPLNSIMVPLQAEQDVLGVLILGGPRAAAGGEWRSSDQQLALAVATHSAIILQSLERRRSLQRLDAECGRLLRERHTDELTGLANRRGLHEAFRCAAGSPRPLAVVYIDLDDFKSINDTHGHVVGDTLLRVVGARLRGVIRSDDLAARVGGDEFVLLLSSAPDEVALRDLLERVEQVIASPVQAGTVVVEPRASVGSAVGCSVTDGEDLVSAADQSMYAQKRLRHGRNQLRRV